MIVIVEVTMWLIVEVRYGCVFGTNVIIMLFSMACSV